MGLSAALKEKVEFADGGVKSAILPITIHCV